MKQDIVRYNPKLKERAKELWKHMTLAEVLLWKELKAGKLLGYDFNRQRPIDEYIVDFYCKELHLAVEVDGRSHDSKEDRDDRRDERLRSLGVEVLRFWDSDVRQDMKSMLGRIGEWIGDNVRSKDGKAREPTPPDGTPPEEGI